MDFRPTEGWSAPAMRPSLSMLVILLASLSGGAAQGVTYLVSTTADSGAGTLRQAILQSNANPGTNLIHFALSGGRPFTITPATPLPAITNSVIIDGTTQPGYATHPVIAIRGTSVGANADGLLLQAGGCTVRGLAIASFGHDGIRLEGPGTNIIQGNYLGTDVTGTVALGNGESGLMIYNSPGNLIGGTSATNRNVISGGNSTGMYLFEPLSRGNRIIGNYLGTDANGTADLGNQHNGVAIINASGNTVGGTNAAERNVISGNDQSGVYLYSIGAASNVIAGNFIGTSVWGTNAIGNAIDGVTIYGAPGNWVGGTNAGAGNLISGNRARGVEIVEAGAEGNVVAGNLIGTDLTGRFAVANQTNGVVIGGGTDNLVGGTSPGARNVISGNGQSGVFITSDQSVNNRVEGNFIGVDVTGTNALGNEFNGVALDGGVSNFLGGAVSGAGNVISGNHNNGVFIVGSAVTNFVQGNRIGTDPSGTSRLPNRLDGVRVETAGNTIGGLNETARNVVSGNGQNGVLLGLPACTGNLLLGNYVGVDMSGRHALGNALAGIGLTNAPANLIGGAATAARNTISGNGDVGIFLAGAGASGNRIEGNYVGTDVSGTEARPNHGGIYLYGSPSNWIGGTASGAGNLISGNQRVGIAIGDPGANGNVVAGNFIGTRADGVGALGNEWHGVELLNTASNNAVGGTVAGAGNRIAFAQTSAYDGVRVRDGCTRNQISGNSMFSNGGNAPNGLGVDLATDGVNADDSCDADNGGNQIQNYPQLVRAYGGDRIGIQGMLNSQADTPFRLQFFADSAAEPSGYGEGQTFLGETLVTTGGTCSANFAVAFNVPVSPGQLITATATDPLGNTSEFSAEVIVQPRPRLTVKMVAASQLSLAWPLSAGGLTLQETDSLRLPIQWRSLTNIVRTNGGSNLVRIPAQGTSRFFRLALER